VAAERSRRNYATRRHFSRAFVDCARISFVKARGLQLRGRLLNVSRRYSVLTCSVQTKASISAGARVVSRRRTLVAIRDKRLQARRCVIAIRMETGQLRECVPRERSHPRSIHLVEGSADAWHYIFIATPRGFLSRRSGQPRLSLKLHQIGFIFRERTKTQLSSYGKPSSVRSSGRTWCNHWNPEYRANSRLRRFAPATIAASRLPPPPRTEMRSRRLATGSRHAKIREIRRDNGPDA